MYPVRYQGWRQSAKESHPSHNAVTLFRYIHRLLIFLWLETQLTKNSEIGHWFPSDTQYKLKVIAFHFTSYLRSMYKLSCPVGTLEELEIGDDLRVPVLN